MTPTTPTLDEQLRDIVFKAAGGISNMAEVEIPAIKQAVYAALVEHMPENDGHTHVTRNYCLDCAKRDGYNKALREALSVLSVVLGIGEEK